MSAAAATVTSNVAIGVQQEDALYTVVPEAWYLQRGVEWPLQGLEFDVTGAHGQARRLDLAVVAEKVESFGHAPPSEPYGVTLWPCDEAGMLLSFSVSCVPTPSPLFPGSQHYVLSGQHGVRALMDIRAQWEAEGRGDLPRWLEVVRADVLSPTTPVELRRLAAGEEQYRQQMVSRVRVSEFLRHLVNWQPAGPRVELAHRIADAVAVAGYQRLDKVCFSHPAAAGGPFPHSSTGQPPEGVPPSGGLLRAAGAGVCGRRGEHGGEAGWGLLPLAAAGAPRPGRPGESGAGGVRHGQRRRQRHHLPDGRGGHRPPDVGGLALDDRARHPHPPHETCVPFPVSPTSLTPAGAGTMHVPMFSHPPLHRCTLASSLSRCGA